MNEVESDARLRAITPRVRRAWYVFCTSDDLRRGPVRRVVHGTPWVVFRTEHGAAAVLEDRCPHRSVALSSGRVVGETLQCRYHGWRIGRDGACAHVPALDADQPLPRKTVLSLPVREQQGFVWAWTAPEEPPRGEPFRFVEADDPAFLTVRKALPVPGPVHSVIENALDVPHTAFLHGGLFREDKADRRRIRCHIRRFADRAECWYLGEQAPTGLAARILSPSGGEITHVDRFHLPSITEVEYRIGEENQVFLRGACTPVDDWNTVMYAVVSLRSRLPHALLRPIVEPIALRIFGQDADILGEQVDQLKGFGEARYTSTEIDVLGHHILRLLHTAARDGLPTVRATEPEYERDVAMWV